MTETWRCFVAVPIGERLRDELAVATSAWQAEEDAPDLRWADPAGWHITLAFLGSTDPVAVAGITERLAAAAATHGPLVVDGGALGAFPRPGAARVLWYGIGADPRLTALAADVGVELGVGDARPLRPHLTLARARDRDGTDLRGWLDGRMAPHGAIAVDELVLYRSHLGRGPARYEAVARVPLHAAATVPA